MSMLVYLEELNSTFLCAIFFLNMDHVCERCVTVVFPSSSHKKRVSLSPRRIRGAFTVELGTKLTCRSHPATCRPSNAWGSRSSSDSPKIFWLVYFHYKVMTKSYSQTSLD